MRYLSSLAVGALLLHISMSYPAVAQEDDSWIEYVNREDRFSINLPAQPTVEEFTYISEYESPWEARRYTAEHEGFIYRMTVVDMSTTSLTPEQDQYRNVGRHGNELRGAMAFAAMQLRQTGTVTLDAYEELQVIPGHKLEITLPDGSANIVQIHTHLERLYILEYISPPGAVQGYDVQASVRILDAEGGVPRYVDWSFPGPVAPVQSDLPTFAAGGEVGELLNEDDPWIEYVNREDRFSINLPVQPTVEEFIYISEYNSPWEARRYTAEHEGYTYRMAVVDMSTTSLAPEQDQYRDAGGYGKELRGAMAFAATQLRQTGTVTLDAYDELQVIPGHKLEITLPDGSVNIVQIHTHMARIYILECISPPRTVPGYDVQASLQILDAEGRVPRYGGGTTGGNWSFPGPIPRAEPRTGGGAGEAQ